jgi:hypothetical protein
MASEACPICGEEADADKIDAHGHFSSDDDSDDDVDVVHFLVTGVRKDRLACGDDADDNPSSTNRGDVNCAACRSSM